jgi:SAM-dependent methyltransferase
MFGREKAYGEPDWKRRLGYALLGELHIPGRLRVWHMIKELRRLGYWQQKPIALLDAGGGEGAFAYYCARRFPDWQVVVVDDEPNTILRGQRIKDRLQLHNLEVCHADLLDLHAEPRYDVIICSDVLEHIERDDIVMQNLVHALKTGGVLLLTSPAIPQPRHLALVAWHEQRIGFHPSQYGHVRDGYSVDDVQRLFQNTNLHSATIRWTFGRCGTLMFDLFFVTGDSQPNPLVYMLLFPVYMGLSVLDVGLPIRYGSGILAVGKKR